MKKAKIKDLHKYIAHVKENPKAFCDAFYDKLQENAHDDSERLRTACKSLITECKYFIIRNGKKKILHYPLGQCRRCSHYQEEGQIDV